MAISYPVSYDSFTTKVDGTDYPQALDINDLQDAVEALEVKVGKDNATDGTSHEYILNNEVIQKYMVRGYFERAQFTHNGGTTAYTYLVDAAAYTVKDKYAYWDSQLTTNAPGSPTADTWYYLYLDYSAITSGTKITASELIWSNTAPSWSNTYRQWMNGDDRCIFAALTNDTPNNFIEPFHDGYYVCFANYIQDYSGASESWTDVTLTMPGFSRKAQITFKFTVSPVASTNAYWRTKGQTGSTGHLVGALGTSYTTMSTVSTPVITDSTNNIQVVVSSYSGATLKARTDGWYFPQEM